MKLLIRFLSGLIVLALAVAALGYLMPERFGLVGMIGVVALIPSTVLLGVVQLVHTLRNQQRNVR